MLGYRWNLPQTVDYSVFMTHTLFPVKFYSKMSKISQSILETFVVCNLD